MKFARLGVQAKIRLLTVAISGCLLIFGGAGLLIMKNLSKSYEHVTHVNLPTTEVLGRMLAEAKEVVQLQTLIATTKPNSPEVAEQHKDLEAAKKRYQDADQLYKKMETERGDLASYELIEKKWRILGKIGGGLLELAASSKPSDQAEARDLLRGDFDTARREYHRTIESHIEHQREDAAKHVEEARTLSKRTQWLITVFALGIFALALTIGNVFGTRLSRTLTSLVERLSLGSEALSKASSDIATSSEKMSSSAIEQSSSIEHIASAVSELSSMVGKNAENAKRSREVAESSRSAATQGQEVVQEMISAIGEISGSTEQIRVQVENSNEEISKIVSMILEIADKTRVINDIVFQTKLLSFNASVEAARAGEAGKGFAVVAEEVGKLAEMSGNAAKEISEMLNRSTQEVQGIVSRTRDSVGKQVNLGVSKIAAGNRVAVKCGEVLGEIVNYVNQVHSMVDEITTASSEQARAIESVNGQIGQMEQVTRENASAAQVVSTVTLHLAEQSQKIRDMALVLSSTVRGQGDSSASVETDSAEATLANHRAAS